MDQDLLLRILRYRLSWKSCSPFVAQVYGTRVVRRVGKNVFPVAFFAIFASDRFGHDGSQRSCCEKTYHDDIVLYHLVRRQSLFQIDST